MGKKVYSLFAVMIVLAFMLTACGGGGQAADFKACQVTDVGGIDDKSFNATVWNGFEKAKEASAKLNDSEKIESIVIKE